MLYMVSLCWNHLPTGRNKLGLAHPCISDVVSAAQQYYKGKNNYKYIPVAAFADAFQKTEIAKRGRDYLEQPYQAPNKKSEEALITHHYALTCEPAHHPSAATPCIPKLLSPRELQQSSAASIRQCM